MKYNFTDIIDRVGKDAIAVEGLGTNNHMAPEGPKEGFDIIPMWIADMNFRTVPTVSEEIIKRSQHPLFGYFAPRDEYFDAIINWHKIRKHVDDIKPEYIGYENGVLGGLISTINVLCSKGDNVLVHSPTYVGFTNSLKNNGYNIVHSDLYLDDSNIYRMDYDDMEKKIVENNIHAAIFCSPHNPTGRVWEREEIEKAMEIYKKHDVFVVSDEIWSDIIMPGYKHIATQSISQDAKERTVAQYAPSKTFNLAGLVGSYHVIYNKWLRDRILKESSLCHYNTMNVLSMYALIGGYTKEGNEWASEMIETINKNIDYACNFIDENFKGLKYSRPQGTYMLFLDCTDYCEKTGKSIDEVLKAGWDVGVAYQDGRLFNGPKHIRINLALPLTRVEEAFDRMKKYVFV